MALHTVSDTTQLTRCLAAIGADQALLLFGNAVGWAPELPSPTELEFPVYVLREDIALQAVTPAPGTEVIDYACWLKLTETHAQHVHWR